MGVRFNALTLKEEEPGLRVFGNIALRRIIRCMRGEVTEP
jgi:hypothetical protein